VSAMPSLVAVREAGGIARTLAALRGDEWALTRSLVRPAAERFSGLLNEPDGMAVAHGCVQALLHDTRIEDELAPRLAAGVKNLVAGSGPSGARIAATAVRNLAAESVLRPRLVHKGVGSSLARMLVEGPLAPHPTSDADLVLAAEF